MRHGRPKTLIAKKWSVSRLSTVLTNQLKKTSQKRYKSTSKEFLMLMFWHSTMLEEVESSKTVKLLMKTTTFTLFPS